jgi:hypothetical protein
VSLPQMAALLQHDDSTCSDIVREQGVETTHKKARARENLSRIVKHAHGVDRSPETKSSVACAGGETVAKD